MGAYFMIIAQSLVTEILTAFKFAERQSFTQIATIAKLNGAYLPKARTVLLYYLEDRNAFRFSCSTNTHKWVELSEIPKITGIFFDARNTTQYRFEANAQLIDHTTKMEYELYNSSWSMLRASLREQMWQEYLADPNEKYRIEEICPHHGTVILKPYYWDIFKLDTINFANSNRTQVILKDNLWQIFQDTPQIHPLDLLH